jgi:basic amino acid/polyamine antiporter, APA family
VPVAGSAYTFSYATLGEFVAWLIGWDLILEFTLGAATVAKGWSGYLVSVFEIVGIKLPTSLYASPESGVSHDWIALIVVALVTTILVIGIRLSSQFNAVITTIKILNGASQQRREGGRKDEDLRPATIQLALQFGE